MGSSPITNNRSTLAFDGKNAHISLGSMQVDYSQGYTVEAWVRYESFNHWSRIIDFGNGAGADNILLANQETTDNLYSHVFHGSTTKNLGVKTLQLNQWTHVAATIDKSHKTILYKDGEPVLDGTTWLPRSVNRTKCYIGRSNWPTDAYFQGQMAEVRIWKVARSQEQIQAEIYTRLSGAEPELVGYWPMDEGEGGVAHDRSSAAHHGSLHAATWAQAELPVKSAKRGPFGATTAGRAFVIVPPDGMAEPRIKVVGIHHAWAVAQPQVQYESLTEEPTSIDSSLQGTHFEVPRNDYLVAVSAGWGSQAPQYVRNELITLQLETYRGLKSPLYGGGSGNYDVDKFELRADEGQKIIGFFGTRGGTQDLPQRLGLYLGEITETMDDLEPALIFDGQNSSVDMGAQAAFKVPKALTLEAWVSAAAQQKWAGIVSKTYDTGSTESGYGMLLDGDGGVCFSLKPQSKSMQYLNTGKGSLELHRWHHVAMTYDGQRMTITIDGAEVKTQAVAASAIDYDPDHNLYLGMYKDDDETYPFHGKMAEVRIWNVARSLDDILNTKDQRLAGNEPGLVAYWPLSEGAGETVHDHTSNGSNAVVHLATWREHVLPALENPQPTVFEVTNTENSGPGSLRKAIRDANAAGRAAVITFNVGGGGAQTIALQQVLPNVTGSVSIDGSTQPGFSGEPLIKIQFGGIALTLRSATDATINDLDLSWTGDAAKGTAFRADYCTNLTLRNLKTANRVMGVVVAYSTDVRVLDNDLRDAGREGDQFSLYLHTIQADKLPGGIEVRGNRFGDAEGACFIYKMKDLKISDGSVQGSNIVLDKGGFDTMGGTWDVLELQQIEDTTIENLDLSYAGEEPKGAALRINGGSNVTVRNLTTANRLEGIVIVGVTDARVLDNDLRQCGFVGDRFALYLHTIEAGQLPGGVEVRGNRFGDAEGAFMIYKMKDLKISDGSVEGSNIVLDKGGFDTMGGTWDVLEFQQLEDTTIENLDLSYAGEEPKGSALRITGGSNVTVRNLTTANRLEGVVVVGVTDARVLDNDLRQCGFVGDRFALYLHTIEPGQLPGGVEVRGNRFGDAEGAFMIYKMKDLKISDGSVEGSNIVLDKGGFDTMGGTWDVLDIRELENSTIEGLDLSYAGEQPKGVALRVGGGSNVTVRDLDARNRTSGVIITGVKDARVESLRS